MKKDSVASSALVTPTEEHRARFKGSRALTGGNRSRAHHDSAPRKVTPGQPGSAPDGTPRAGRENAAAAAGARPGPSPSPVLSPAPLHGTKLGEAVSDRQHLVCGEPLRLPVLARPLSPTPPAAPSRRRPGFSAGPGSGHVSAPAAHAPSSCVCPYSVRWAVTPPPTCASILST